MSEHPPPPAPEDGASDGRDDDVAAAGDGALAPTQGGAEAAVENATDSTADTNANASAATDVARRDEAPSLLARATRVAPKVLPVASLAFSAVSAVLMSRRPEDAPKIVGFALLGWALVVVTAVVVRHVDAKENHSRWVKVGRFMSVLASQNILGQALAFPLPFFLLAAWPPILIQTPFVIAYGVAVVIVVWDPYYDRLATRPVPLLALQAFAALVASLTVLPMLGLSNTWTFVVAGVVVGIGIPVGTWIAVGADRRRMAVAGVGALVMIGVVFIGAPLVPPAPLRIESKAMGTHIEKRLPQGVSNRFTKPNAIVCHTAIAAPLGLKDVLRHEWTRDGEHVQDVVLEVTGGASTGFRTWSRVTRPKPGSYRCRVATLRGQVVGDVFAVVE
jgi:hypothetical protein